MEISNPPEGRSQLSNFILCSNEKIILLTHVFKEFYETLRQIASLKLSLTSLFLQQWVN